MLMATTAIWNITGGIGKALAYVKNPDKTINPEYLKGLSYLDSEEIESLTKSIEYIMQAKKAGHAATQEHFVTGINVAPGSAMTEMMAVKKQFGKMGGNTAYHAYQSFKPGEVAPDIAHEIGVRLAQEIWGDRFQVAVATHIDQKHIHNHFILNSVSFIDGKKYNDCKKTYYAIRAASDRLCKEYSLSVVENPKPGKSKHYAEWSADRCGKPTWRSIVKKDVDDAIRESMTDAQFFSALKTRGYEIKTGKDISVRPPGKERFFRLARNFGEGYTLPLIRQRILRQTSPHRNPPPRAGTKKRHKGVLSISRRRKVGGLIGLYLHYLYLLGRIPKKRTHQRKPHFVLKEDIAKLELIVEGARLLISNRIETQAHLSAYRSEKHDEANELAEERAKLRNMLKRKSPPDGAEHIRKEISMLTGEMKKLRREIRICDDIAGRSSAIKEKLSVISTGNEEREEMNQNAIRRRSR
jgi:hypothetical protein